MLSTEETGCYITSVGSCFGVSHMFCNHGTISFTCPEGNTQCGLCEECTAGNAVWEGTRGTVGEVTIVQHERPNILLSTSSGISHGLPDPKA